MSRTILIAEDNDMFRGMLSSMLALRGYIVIAGRDGSEALALAAAQPIDGVLADVEMPGMDGFEFCAQIRAQQQAAGRDVPVWIMSDAMRPALSKKAAAAGAVLVLRKPFPIDEVCAKIEAEFQKRADTATPDRPAGANEATAK
jgi:CheY-like chemotaxis protein